MPEEQQNMEDTNPILLNPISAAGTKYTNKLEKSRVWKKSDAYVNLMWRWKISNRIRNTGTHFSFEHSYNKNYNKKRTNKL